MRREDRGMKLTKCEMLVYQTEMHVAEGVVKYTFGGVFPVDERIELAPQLVWRSSYYPPTAIFNKTDNDYFCHSFLVRLIVAAGLITFSEGLLLASYHLCLEHIAWELHICDINSSSSTQDPLHSLLIFTAHVFITSNISAIVGSLIAGRWLYKRSRRKLIIFLDVVLGLACICSCIADSYLSILWAQFLIGLATGMESVCIPIYIAELSPRKVRGRCGVTRSLCLSLGVLIGTCIAMPLHVVSPLPLMYDNQLLVPQLH